MRTEPAAPPAEAAPLWPLRWLNLVLLLAWLWKLWVFIRLEPVLRLRPLRMTFFPPLLESYAVLVGSYALPVAAGVALAVRPTLRGARIVAPLWLGAALMLLWHQGSYNDATFVTCAWTALWMSWYAWRRPRAHEDWRLLGPVAAQCVIALMFLGGAVGKLTPEFLSGEVFYDIYFVDRDFWTYRLLRAHLTPETLRALARPYAVAAVAVELAGALSFLVPTRLALRFAIVVMVGMVVTNNFLLVSVLGPLVGLAVAGLWLLGPAARAGASADPELRR